MSQRISVRAFGIATVLCLIVLVKGSDGTSVPGFPQPAVHQSSSGILSLTLRTAIAPNLVTDPTTSETRSIETPTYNGTIPGPTIRVKPGDTMDMLLINDLPPNPAGQRMGGFPHDPHTTNLHTHGLTVSPQGISDNVLREMGPGTTNPVRIEIPSGHQSGTFWYHAHKHGSVSYQLFGGMAGFLIVDGGPGTLDSVPEVKNAREVLMAFQEIRTDKNGRLPFVNPAATQAGADSANPQGLWTTLDDGNVYFTTNGVTSPALLMRPGEVQRWRLLNAASGATLVVALEGHSLNVIANDGITVPNMQTLAPGQPYVMGTGQRVDLLVKAGELGIYRLQALDPASSPGWPVVSASGIDPAPRNVRFGSDLPNPTFPVTLATIVVWGRRPVNMPLPAGPLPVPTGIPSIETMLSTPPNVVRKVAFEICGQRAFMQPFSSRLPTCGFYFDRYDANFWGGTNFTTLAMMRDADDAGTPSSDPAEPLVDFQKDGLFVEDEPLFDNMIVGNFEEWTVINRSFSDHTFHIHQNPFLVTHVNGTPLSVPEWHDTIIVPAARPQPGQNDINEATFGSITFRTNYDPVTVGSFVTHCHVLNHEDIGMMHRLEIRDRSGSPAVANRRTPARHKH